MDLKRVYSYFVNIPNIFMILSVNGPLLLITDMSFLIDLFIKLILSITLHTPYDTEMKVEGVSNC